MSPLKRANPVASVVALAGVLFLFVFPTSSWLAQRRDRHQVEAQLRRVTARNQSLERRVRLLRTPQEIERIAREKYNLVRPGEEAFAILPAPPPKLAVPPVWPFTGLAEKLSK